MQTTICQKSNLRRNTTWLGLSQEPHVPIIPLQQALAPFRYHNSCNSRFCSNLFRYDVRLSPWRRLLHDVTRELPSVTFLHSSSKSIDWSTPCLTSTNRCRTLSHSSNHWGEQSVVQPQPWTSPTTHLHHRPFTQYQRDSQTILHGHDGTTILSRTTIHISTQDFEPNLDTTSTTDTHTQLSTTSPTEIHFPFVATFWLRPIETWLLTHVRTWFRLAPLVTPQKDRHVSGRDLDSYSHIIHCEAGCHRFRLIWSTGRDLSFLFS